MTMGLPDMSRILGPVSMHLAIDWREPVAMAAREVRVSAYGADADGIPMRDGDRVFSVGSLREPELRIAQVSGSGALVSLVRDTVRDAASRVLQTYLVRQAMRRADFGLFALDHDGGHGPEVASGVRELWAQSGPDLWAAYADKRAALLRWLEEAP